MTFTFIIMDSLYIMRNLLMIFFLMVVFLTNLGNCEGFCDRYTQCHYNETRIHVTVSCMVETARGNTAHPCYGHGTKVVCACSSENHQLSSPNNSYLCSQAKWADGLHDLRCSIIPPCDEPAPPDDLVFHIPDLAEGEMYANGTEIMYDCPDGFELNGHMTAVCLYGEWTYEDAYCTALPCDEPAPPDDSVFHIPDLAEGAMYAHGTEIMYYCPDGFDLNGHMTAVCVYGVWTYEDANCTASPCDEPAPPDDLVFHIPDLEEGEMYANGTEIMYYCPDGFELNGHMTAVCLYGVWTYEDANCTGELTTEISTTPIDITTTPIGSCDKYTQCVYDVARVISTVSCNIETARGNTAPPCYGDGSKVTCSGKGVIYRLFGTYKSFLCIPDKWEDGLYDFHCEINWWKIIIVLIIAICTLLFAVLLIRLVKKHCLRRGTKWIPSVEGVANEQVPRTANDESKFVSKVDFEMSDPNGYQNDVNKEDNDACDHVGDNIRGDLPNNDPEEETV